LSGATKDQMRADQLVKRRQQEHEQMEMKKKKIEDENRMQAIEEKFKAHYDAVEQMLKTDTVGLVSLDEMKKKQEDMIHAREQQLAREKEAKLNESNKNQQGQRKDANGHHRPNKLSFADQWNEEDDAFDDDDDHHTNDSHTRKQDDHQHETANDEINVCSLLRTIRLLAYFLFYVKIVHDDENSLSNELIKHGDADSNDSELIQGPTVAELDRLVLAAKKKKRLGKNPGKKKTTTTRTMKNLR
jgi:hypothetical protein